MVNLNRSRAKRFLENAQIENPFNQSYLQYGQNNPNQSFIFGSERVDRIISYYNESFHDISIIDGTGMTLDLPASRTAGSRLVVCITYKWGHEVQFNPAAMLKHSPIPDEEYVRDLTHRVKHLDTNKPRELDLYYVIDLSTIDKDPYGIWIEALNVQIVATKFSKTTTLFTQSCFFNKNEELYDMEQIVWATTTTLAYFVNDPNYTEIAYVPMGFDLLEVIPVYRPDVPQGLHINLRGKTGFAASKSNKRAIYIPPEDFHKYGIYRTAREWDTAFKASLKGLTKEEIKARMDVYKEVHEINDDSDRPKAANVRDIFIFGDYTVGSIIDFISELSKLDGFLEKIFKKK